MAETYSAGIVTAYGAAVRGGYTGTYEQFCAEQAQFGANAAKVAQDRAAVEAATQTFTTVTVPGAVQAVQQTGATQVQAVEAASETEQQQIALAGAAQETRVTQAGDDQVDAVEEAGATHVGNVNTAGTTQVGNVNTAGTTQVGAVNTAGATQVQAVEDKGQEVIDSIPDDYTELTEDVADLKTAITQTNANVLNDDIRNALLGCFQNVTWSSPDGLIYYDALQDALFNNSFTVTNTLTNCTTSNNATKVSSGGSYEATITGINNYAIESATVSITMGGVDITQTAYSDGVINIASVTGNLSITVSLSVQMFDYIKQTGDVRDENAIITDVAMSSDYILETAFYYTSSTYGGNVPIFGTRASQYGAKQIAIFVKPTTTDMGYWFGGTDSATSITGVSNNTLNTLVISPVGTSVTYPNNATIKVNNTEYNSDSTSTGVTWANWFTFFGYGYSATNNAVVDNIGLRFYETKIKNSGGTLLHDFVPANNGTYNGFYDRVTKTFYCNEENNSLYECGND